MQYGVKRPDSECTYPCRGNSGEICGADTSSTSTAYRITIYQYQVSGFLYACVLVLCALSCKYKKLEVLSSEEVGTTPKWWGLDGNQRVVSLCKEMGVATGLGKFIKCKLACVFAISRLHGTSTTAVFHPSDGNVHYTYASIARHATTSITSSEVHM